MASGLIRTSVRSIVLFCDILKIGGDDFCDSEKEDDVFVLFRFFCLDLFRVTNKNSKNK